MDNYGCLQGARLLGMGTLIFSRNYAKGTFIREGTFIRQCIVVVGRRGTPYYLNVESVVVDAVGAVERM